MSVARGAARARARVAFLGSPEVALPALDAILAADDLEVVLVVTNPDRPRGRSDAPRPTPVREAAVARGLPVATPDGRVELATVLAAARPDVVAVVAYGTLLDAAALAACGAGAVNLHFSLLPRWRGAAPVQAAIRARDGRTGVTAFLIDAGMDTGPILASESTPIASGETAGELLDRLARLGAPVLVEALRRRLAGATGEPQSTEGATRAPRLTAADLVLDLDRPAVDVAAQVASLAPTPGAVVRFRDGRWKVLAVAVVEDAPAGRPGEVVAVAADGPVVACGDGAIRIERARPEGRGTMTGADLVNGLRPTVGERFTTPLPDGASA